MKQQQIEINKANNLKKYQNCNKRKEERKKIERNDKKERKERNKKEKIKRNARGLPACPLYGPLVIMTVLLSSTSLRLVVERP
jgi:hypothetical protein